MNGKVQANTRWARVWKKLNDPIRLRKPVDRETPWQPTGQLQQDLLHRIIKLVKDTGASSARAYICTSERSGTQACNFAWPDGSITPLEKNQFVFSLHKDSDDYHEGAAKAMENGRPLVVPEPKSSTDRDNAVMLRRIKSWGGIVVQCGKEKVWVSLEFKRKMSVAVDTRAIGGELIDYSAEGKTKRCTLLKLLGEEGLAKFLDCARCGEQENAEMLVKEAARKENGELLEHSQTDVEALIVQ